MRPIFLVIGVLLTILGIAMLLPMMIDLLSGHPAWRGIGASSLITMLTGLSLWAATRGVPQGLSTRQAMLMTVASWLALVTFGAIPFVWTDTTQNFTDAFFESMSGITTTGATVIKDLDQVSDGMIFWRALMQWLGGLGVLVMAVAVLPMLQIGGMQLFKAEAFDTPDKILPRAGQISGSMTLVFLSFTFICAGCYLIAGLNPQEALTHAMSTIATGGFSSRNGSIGEFQNGAVDWITIFFMILGSIPFLLYVQFLQGRATPLFKDQQVRTFLLVLGVAIVIAWAMAHAGGHHNGIEGLRFAAFNVVSVMTGTGYASTDYAEWGPHASAFFFGLMFVGGCAGSTACGIKIFRFQILFLDIGHHIKRSLYPHGTFPKRYNGRIVDDRITSAVMSFFFLFFASFFILSILLSLTGLDFVTSISGAGTVLSNVGPGIGDTIGPAGSFASLNPTAKWLLSFGMLLGRLELFTVYVLFLPSFWRD